MKNRTHKQHFSLKNYFFIDRSQTTSRQPEGISKDEQERFSEYLESYQQVTRWK